MVRPEVHESNAAYPVWHMHRELPDNAGAATCLV